MNGYFKTICIGDYSVNVWVNCTKNASSAERIEQERKAIIAAVSPALASYRVECKAMK